MNANKTISTPQRIRVNPNSLHRPINLLLFLGSSFLLGTGWILDSRLPRGRPGHGLTVLSLDRHQWGDLHAWTAYILMGLVVAHLALHHAWLSRVAASGHAWRLAAGLTAGAAILAFLMLVPVRA